MCIIIAIVNAELTTTNLKLFTVIIIRLIITVIIISFIGTLLYIIIKLNAN